MVAMRQDAGACSSSRNECRSSEVETAIANREEVEVVLSKCAAEMTRAMLSSLRKERAKRALLPAQVWHLVLNSAVFNLVKSLNLHMANREGTEEDVQRRIMAYEKYANEKLGGEFLRMCKSLNDWREGQQKPDVGPQG